MRFNQNTSKGKDNALLWAWLGAFKVNISVQVLFALLSAVLDMVAPLLVYNLINYIQTAPASANFSWEASQEGL